MIEVEELKPRPQKGPSTEGAVSTVFREWFGQVGAAPRQGSGRTSLVETGSQGVFPMRQPQA